MHTAKLNPLPSTMRIWFAAVVLVIMSEPAQTASPIQTIACVQAQGQAISECNAIISLDENESGTVTVTFRNGFSRTLYVKNGAFIRANPTMSGTGKRLEWKLKGDTHYISVDGQRYEIERSAIPSR